MRTFILILIGLLSITTFAQKAEVNVKLTRPDGNPASGIVQISGGDTTIIDNSFVSPKNYILRTVTGINDISKQPEIKYWPNPTLNGNLNVTIPGSGRLEGILDIVDFSGKHIGKMDLSKDDGLKLNVKPGNILIQYENRHEKQVFKIVNFAEQLNVNIFQGNTFGLNSGNGLKSNNIFNDEFTLTATDPANNWQSYLLNFSVPVGTRYSVDDLLEWSEKTIKYKLKTNTDTKIIVSKAADATILDEKTTSTGILPTHTISQKFNNETGLKINYKLISVFTDTVTLTRTQFASEEVTIDTIRNNHFYVAINGNGEQYRVLSGAQVLVTGNTGKQSFFKMPADSIKVNIEVSGSGMVTRVLPVTLGKGIYTQTVNLEKANYSHALTVNLVSSIQGKIIEDGTPVYIIKDFQNASTDTTWVISENGKFTFAWSDNNQTMTSKIGCINFSGHQGNSLSFTMDDAENVDITFTGLQYNLTQPVFVKNQYDEIVAGATVTGGDLPVVTDEKGTATVTISNLATDDHNLPLPVYSLTLVVTNNTNLSISSHYIDAVAGTNNEAQLKVLQYYEQWFYGTNTTPDGALVQVWLNGEVKESVAVSNHSYETKHIKRPTKTFEADSVTISKENYKTFVQKNVMLTEGGTRLEATLTEIVVNYTHSLTINAQSSVAGKLIKDGTPIYIMKDFTNAPTDTTWATITNGVASITWTDQKQTLNTKTGAKTVAGHQANSITFTMDDDETKTISFTGLTYSLTQPVLAHNQFDKPVSGATITGGDVTVSTNEQGRATVTINNLTTNENNLPLTEYALELIIEKTGFPTVTYSFIVLAGSNPEKVILFNEVKTYTHNVTAILRGNCGSNIQPDTPHYVIKDAVNAPKDTTWVNSGFLLVQSFFHVEWADTLATASVKIGSKSVPGHLPAEISFTVTDFISQFLYFPCLSYDLTCTVPVQITDENNRYLPNITITSGNKSVTTSADGMATLVTSVYTNEFNLPLESYPFTFTLTGTYIETGSHVVQVVRGTNNLVKLRPTLKPPVNHNFDIVLRDINGNTVTDLTQRFELEDGTVYNLTPDAGGIIHFESINPSTTVKVSNNSSKYCNDFQVYRKTNHDLKELNFAQTSRFDGIAEAVTLPLTNIPGQIVEYVTMSEVDAPDAIEGRYGYGSMISITDPTVLDMMGGRAGCATTKFVPRPGAETIYVFQMTFNETTGAQMDVAQLDRAKAVLDKILAIFPLPYEFYRINSYTDPNFLESKARDNHDNMVYTTFDNSSPLNGVGLTPTYSLNNLARIKDGSSWYNVGTSSGIIFEEIYQSFTNNKDPQQGTGPWIRNLSGDVSEFGATMFKIIYMLDQGTPTR